MKKHSAAGQKANEGEVQSIIKNNQHENETYLDHVLNSTVRVAFNHWLNPN